MLPHFESHCRPNSTVRLLIDESDLYIHVSGSGGPLIRAPNGIIENITNALIRGGPFENIIRLWAFISYVGRNIRHTALVPGRLYYNGGKVRAILADDFSEPVHIH